MSAFHHGAIHLARRGVEVAQAHFHSLDVAHLQQDTQANENAGWNADLKPEQFLPVLITGFVVLLIMLSIDYTLGSVMTSLAMIECPSSTAIIEPKEAPPPAYTDEPDTPLEMGSLVMPGAADADVEVTVINHKPVTASIRATIKHLSAVGGFRARWRGAGFGILYHFLHSLTTNGLGGLLGFGILGNSLMYILSSVALARVHMLWTHSMIAAPATESLRSRFVPRKLCKSLLLPALVYAVAQQATFLVPLSVAFALNLPELHKQQVLQTLNGEIKGCSNVAVLILKALAVPASALVVSLTVLLPAAVTLTRIEATLLPKAMSTIVPFDREAIMGDIDTTIRGGCRALFVEAWRSFDRSTRLRLIKLYVKSALAQLAVAVIGVHVIVAEIYAIGGEKLADFLKDVHAQLQLMAAEKAQEMNAN